MKLRKAKRHSHLESSGHSDVSLSFSGQDIGESRLPSLNCEYLGADFICIALLSRWSILLPPDPYCFLIKPQLLSPFDKGGFNNGSRWGRNYKRFKWGCSTCQTSVASFQVIDVPLNIFNQSDNMFRWSYLYLREVSGEDLLEGARQGAGRPVKELFS